MRLFKFLETYFTKEMITILFLGFSSGLPIVLILSTLKAFLSDITIDIKAIGFFSLISIPYSIKFIWAPFVDSYQIPKLGNMMGKRRSWILLSQLLLIAFIAILGFVSAYHNTLLVAAIALSIAFISATQDIAIDAYRIETIKSEDQAVAVAMYIYGYNTGMLVSGAGALFLSDIFSWKNVYYIMSLLMLVGILAVIFAKENSYKIKESQKNFRLWFKGSVLDPILDFLKRPKWYLIFPFIICFKLGDAFASSLTLPFLLEIGFSKTEIASIVKTFGLFATVFGIFCGGFIVKYLGIVRSLWIAAILQMISNLAFYFQANIGHDILFLYFVIFAENFSGGIGNAVFVAYLSMLCNIAFTATQYAILASFATMSRSILSSSTGIFVAYMGWPYFFLLSTIIAIPSLILLYFMRNLKLATSLAAKSPKQ